MVLVSMPEFFIFKAIFWGENTYNSATLDMFLVNTVFTGPIKRINRGLTVVL